MAIYSLRMTAVGKTTQKQPFTAAAHLKYITRKTAVTHVIAARMPDVRRQAIAWLRREEREDRKNARVIDKVVLALPKELSADQQHALVASFAEKLTQGRASWFAALHTKGKDRTNPHCHLILRDRDVETRRRVMYLSAGKKEAAQKAGKGQAAPTNVTDVRALWERCANAALDAAGRSERIDRRSLKEQGVGRKPQVHEGPNIRAMHRRGFRPLSRDRVVRNSPHRRKGRAATRVVRYAEIDNGMTRAEYNAALAAPGKVSSSRPRVAVAAIAAPPVMPVPPPPQTVRPLPAPARGIAPGAAPARPDVPAPVTPSRPAPPAPPALPQPPLLPAGMGRPLTLTERLARKHGTAAAPTQQPNDRDRGRGR